MHTADTLDRLTFEPPGPGSWLLDSVHVPRPWSRFQAEIHPPNLAEGFRESARRYGLLFDTLDWRIVNGFAYFSVPPAPDAEIPVRFQAADALRRLLGFLVLRFAPPGPGSADDQDEADEIFAGDLEEERPA